VRALALLVLTTLIFARSSIERLDTTRLAAVHAQRVEWMKKRATAPPPPGVYRDFRAILHIHAEVLQAAKLAEVNVVMFTDHRGPKPDTWSGLRDGVLFIPGSEDDHLLRYPADSAGPELRFLSHIEERPDMSSIGFQARLHRGLSRGKVGPAHRQKGSGDRTLRPGAQILRGQCARKYPVLPCY
jgi:hypothetical protein